MKSAQRGFLLLEGLIAILIFSFGVLALIGLQAVVVKETAEAKYRMEASMFTNQLIGQMWAEDKLTIATDFASPSGARYVDWRNEVVAAAGLPGAAANPPTVVFGVNNQVTITVFWQAPGAPTGTPAHRFVTITQLQ